MKALVCVTYAINTPHFETELEIIERHLEAKDDVFVLACDRHLLACDVNPQHSLANCLHCTQRRRVGLAALSGRVTVLPQIQLETGLARELAELSRRDVAIQDLARLTIDNFDLGFGVLSSLVSWRRDPEPEPSALGDIPQRMMVSALAVYRTVQNLIDSHGFERVYVYNGRYAAMRAVLRACESRGVDCYTHEKGGTLDRYALWKNAMAHDLENTAALIEQAWRECPDLDERVRLGTQFYEDSASGISRTWIAFTAAQRADLLPSGWDPGRINVALFVSSEDEFVAIGDQWNSGLYPSQQEGIERIAASTASDPRIHLYVRVHPNLSGLDNAQTRGLRALRGSNLTLIPAESKVSTYALLRSARVIVTFGSTVGIEAAYWGKPSILAGEAYYRFLGVTHNPRSHEELVGMLLSDLSPGDRTQALKYGYYWATLGESFKYYKPTGIYSGRFKGNAIRPSLFFRLLHRFLAWSLLGRLLGAIDVRRRERSMGLR